MDWGVCNATLEEVFVKIVNKEVIRYNYILHLVDTSKRCSFLTKLNVQPISSNTSTVKVAYDEEKKRPELVETPAKVNV
jgi:hypothetical protein